MHYAELDRAWQELTAAGAPFELRPALVRGQKLNVYARAPADVRALWLGTAVFGERDYMVFEGERLTYGQAHAHVNSVAGWLAQRGVGPGVRVAIAMRNYPEWMLIYWACACLGATVVGMNAWWTSEEIGYAIRDSAPRVLFADGERVERIWQNADLLGTMDLVCVRKETTSGAVAWADVVGASAPPPPAVDIDPDSDMCIFYTSGTTGVPKGAQLTHRSCITNLMNLSFARQVQALATQRATGKPPPPEAVRATLVTTPLFHVTANNCHAYATTAAGGKLVLMYRWDAGDALRLVEEERCTTVSGVPVMARELIAHPDFHARDTSSLTSVGGGGAPLQPARDGKIDRALRNARPGTGYGMTETSGIIASINGDFFADKPSSVGRPMPTFDLRVTGEDGRPLPPGEPGEVWVKGAAVIKGYLNRPEATAETITGGWLQTGDVGYLDNDGFLHLVDRKKEMVLRGGENVYCAEVEAALHRHPAVLECAVFGVPDARLGEEVAAAVVVRAGEDLSPQVLREHCAGIIARYKVPKYLWLHGSPLPRNANGKLLKRDIRATLTIDDAQ